MTQENNDHLGQILIFFSG